MTRPEGWFHRGARPVTLWWLPIFVAVLVLFITAALAIFLRGLWLTVGHGLPAPNLTGNLENLGPLIMAIGTAWGLLRSQSRDRHAERMDQQARGTAPSIPFDPSPPSIGPSPDGPRPGDSP
jgi:hypothetical protein